MGTDAPPHSRLGGTSSSDFLGYSYQNNPAEKNRVELQTRSVFRKVATILLGACGIFGTYFRDEIARKLASLEPETKVTNAQAAEILGEGDGRELSPQMPIGPSTEQVIDLGIVEIAQGLTCEAFIQSRCEGVDANGKKKFAPVLTMVFKGFSPHADGSERTIMVRRWLGENSKTEVYSNYSTLQRPDTTEVAAGMLREKIEKNSGDTRNDDMSTIDESLNRAGAVDTLSSAKNWPEMVTKIARIALSKVETELETEQENDSPSNVRL